MDLFAVEPALAAQLEQWHREDQFQKIVDTIEALPREKLNFTLISDLARAYNNLAMNAKPPKDRPVYQRALDLLLSLEEQAEKAPQDTAHRWSFRVGYAYYYLDQEGKALPYFERALETKPGDEDTQEYIERCRRTLALPVSIKPFRARTLEAWASFWEGEEELRALMDQKDRAAVGEQLVERCSELLSPAFAHPAFEMGYNGEKYELILSPEGDRVRLFQLAYFQKHAPRELLERWNVIVGRTRSKNFGLRMFGQDITLQDVQAWPEQTEDGGMGLKLYCEKLASLPQERENMLYILLDQALGELAAMRYVDWLDVLDAPGEGESVTLDKLADYVSSEIDPEGWARSSDPEAACERYIAYRGNPSEEEWSLREDIFAGSTCCVPLIRAYAQGDDFYMDYLHQEGAVPGFFYYPLDDIAREDILDLRDRLEGAILEKTGPDAVAFTGGATGTVFGYLDFIAWDLKEVLDAAVEVFAAEPVKSATFHTFRMNNTWSIGLKRAE